MIPALYNWVCSYMRLEHRLPVPKDILHTFMQVSRAEPWHFFAIASRMSRPHVCVPCTWICDFLPRQARIFEPACGSGANLLWLYTRGFYNIFGADLSPSAISLAALLAKYMVAPLHSSVDNALQPAHTPSQVDAILSVNWLYHIPNTTLDIFFDVYNGHLVPGGYIIFDMICDSYSQMRNNQWHTGDLQKKPHLRRLSEYRLRMSCDAVATCAARFGLEIVRQERMYTVPKRWVFAVRKK